VLSPTMWALFEALYAGRGHPVSDDFLLKAIHVSGLREHIYQLRRRWSGRATASRRIAAWDTSLTVAQE